MSIPQPQEPQPERHQHHPLDPINKACWACHGYGTDPGGHSDNNSKPGDYRNPWTCVDCHFSYSFMSTSGAAEKFVNESMYNSSAHGSLACEDCHTKGHNNIGARKACEDCHAYQSDPINDIDRQRYKQVRV